jgi:hypothetical protein
MTRLPRRSLLINLRGQVWLDGVFWGQGRAGDSWPSCSNSPELGYPKLVFGVQSVLRPRP